MSQFTNDPLLEKARRHRSRASQIGELLRAGLGVQEINSIVMSGGLEPQFQGQQVPASMMTRSRGATAADRLEEFRDRAAFMPVEPGLFQGRRVQEAERMRRERVIGEQRRRHVLGSPDEEDFRAIQAFEAPEPGQTLRRPPGVTPELASRRTDRLQTKAAQATLRTAKAIQRRFGDSGPEAEEAVARANENITRRNERRIARGLPPQPLLETASGAAVRQVQDRRSQTRQLVDDILQTPELGEDMQLRPRDQAELEHLMTVSSRIAERALADGNLDEDELESLLKIRTRVETVASRATRSSVPTREEVEKRIIDVDGMKFFFNEKGELQPLRTQGAEQGGVGIDPKALEGQSPEARERFLAAGGKIAGEAQTSESEQAVTPQEKAPVAAQPDRFSIRDTPQGPWLIDTASGRYFRGTPDSTGRLLPMPGSQTEVDSLESGSLYIDPGDMETYLKP